MAGRFSGLWSATVRFFVMMPSPAGLGAVRALVGVVSGEGRGGLVLKVDGVVFARRTGYGAEHTAVGLVADIDIVCLPIHGRGGNADTVIDIPYRVCGAGGHHVVCLADRGGDNGCVRRVAGGFIVLLAASCGEHGCYHGRDSEKPGWCELFHLLFVFSL